MAFQHCEVQGFRGAGAITDVCRDRDMLTQAGVDDDMCWESLMYCIHCGFEGSEKKNVCKNVIFQLS